MILISFILLLTFSGEARAADINAQLENECYTEISFFCPKIETRAVPWLKCLDKYKDGITARCQASIDATKLALAPKPAPEVALTPAAGGPAGSGPQIAALPKEMDARLTHLDGSVYVHMAGKPDGQFISGEADMPIETGDQIRTGTNGKAELAINGDSVIDVENNTDFKVDQLTPEKTEWKLDIGSIVAKIHPLLPSQQMQFITPSAVAAIRGTELSMAQDDTGQPSRIGVLDEGKVAVTGAGGGNPVMLSPGQETSVAKGQPPSPPKPLSSLASSRNEMKSIQQRMAAIKQGWKPTNPQAMKQFRDRMARQTPIPASKLSNVRGGQNKLPNSPPNAGSPARGGPQTHGGMQPKAGSPPPSNSKQPNKPPTSEAKGSWRSRLAHRNTPKPNNAGPGPAPGSGLDPGPGGGNKRGHP